MSDPKSKMSAAKSSMNDPMTSNATPQSDVPTHAPPEAKTPKPWQQRAALLALCFLAHTAMHPPPGWPNAMASAALSGRQSTAAASLPHPRG
eukprot:scaffold86437_cov62-Phaeocystis_antarctica.AAC.6